MPVARSTGSFVVALTRSSIEPVWVEGTSSATRKALRWAALSAALTAVRVPMRLVTAAAPPAPPVAAVPTMVGISLPKASAGSVVHPAPMIALTTSVGWLAVWIRPVAVLESPSTYAAGLRML